MPRQSAVYWKIDLEVDACKAGCSGPQRGTTGASCHIPGARELTGVTMGFLAEGRRGAKNALALLASGRHARTAKALRTGEPADVTPSLESEIQRPLQSDAHADFALQSRIPR